MDKDDLARWWFLLTVWVLAVFAVGVMLGTLSPSAPETLLPEWPALTPIEGER